MSQQNFIGVFFKKYVLLNVNIDSMIGRSRH